MEVNQMWHEAFKMMNNWSEIKTGADEDTEDNWA